LGMAADKIGSRRVIAISLVLVSAALFWLVSIGAALVFYLFAAVYSFGIGGSTAMESTVTAELFGMKSHGVLLGAISFGFTAGAAIGPLVTGYLFDLTASYHLAFLICAASGVLGLILTIFLRPIKT
jgi:MFS family permease